MNGNKVSEVKPRCGVIIPCKFEISTGSEAARCLIVPVNVSIDSVKLQACYDRPLVVSTFYHFFISWYVSNYDAIRDLLEKWLREYRGVSLGIHDRLQETHCFLSSAYKIFMQYCIEKGFTSSESAQAHHHSFRNILTSLVREQHERVKRAKKVEVAKVDVYKLIRTLYKSGSLELTKNKKRFNSAPEKYDGLIHGELLCLRGEKLLSLFQKAGYSNTLADIRNDLIAREALYLDSEGKNKKIGNKRVCGIYLNKLD